MSSLVQLIVRAGVLATLALISPGLLAQESVRVPGTAISMVLPDGFMLAERFAGIADESRSASVQVVELPAPVADLQADMTEESLAPRGLQMQSSESVEAGIEQAMLVEVLQSSGGVDYRLWILLGGNDSETALLTARAPEPVDEALAEALRTALLQATRDSDATIDPMEALSFTLEPAGGLEVASTMMGSSVLLTLDGRQTQLEPGEPFLIVAQSIRDDQIENLAEYAAQRLQQTEGAIEVEVREQRELTVDGYEAIELVADIVGENDLQSTVYQLLLRDDGGYVLAQGHVAAGGDAEYLPVFRSIGESLKMR